VQATTVLDHPTLGGSRSYQGMSGHQDATAGAIAITLIRQKLPDHGE
jgi:hypothetical protein